MQEELGRAHDHAACLDRRTWLCAAAAGSLGFVTTAGRRRARAGQKGDGKPDPSGGEPGLNDVRRRLTEAKIGPLAAGPIGPLRGRGRRRSRVHEGDPRRLRARSSTITCGISASAGLQFIPPKTA